LYEIGTVKLLWTGAAVIGLICIVLALTLPPPLVPLSGFAFALLGLWFYFTRRQRWTLDTR